MAFVIVVLPASEAAGVVRRIAPILVFLAAITVVAELSDAAGVFELAAAGAARAARGSVPQLFVLMAALAAVVTIVLSLDTTAVLLTPVVLTLTRRLALPDLPFAISVVWLSNTASLLLPVSNLTNLIAAPRLAEKHEHFTRLMAPSAPVVLGVSVLVLWLRYRSQLRGRYEVTASPVVADRLLVTIATAVCLTAGALFAFGVHTVATAGAAAVLLLFVFAIRARPLLTSAVIPWRLLAGTAALFLFVQACLHLGLLRLLSELTGSGTDPISLLRLTGTAALSSNLINNLPAYLAIEPDATGSPLRLAALLIGTNVGPLILPWGSIATLLWWDRCRARGIVIPVRDFIYLGLLAVPPTLGAGVVALVLSRR